MKRKVYVSGPMTGFPEYNYPAFNKATEILEQIGLEVYNPARDFLYDGPLNEFPIKTAFKEYCDFICTQAEEVYMLKGWEKSVGARAEHALALAVGIEICYQ